MKKLLFIWLVGVLVFFFESCKKCGERFVPENAYQKLCSKCSVYQPISKKTIRCIDCGKEFEVDGIVKNKKRCDSCYKDHRARQMREAASRYYHKNKVEA